MVTATESYRPRKTDVFAAYSSAHPNARYHATAEPSLCEELERINPRLETHGCFYSASDNCKAQYRGRRFFLHIARFFHSRGYSRIHTFAAPHHFKGQHDGTLAAHAPKGERRGRLCARPSFLPPVFCLPGARTMCGVPPFDAPTHNNARLIEHGATSTRSAGAGRDERDNLVSAEVSEQERMPTTFDVFDYNVRTRREPNTSSRKVRGQYAFNRILRRILDADNDQRVRDRMRELDYHELPHSGYLSLDTAANDDATKLENSGLYTQFASFGGDLDPDGSATVWLREFGCCCVACLEHDWSKCINLATCGSWTTQTISPVAVQRDTSATGLALEDFVQKKSVKKGDIVGVFGHPESDDIDEQSRAASYWLGVMQIGVRRAKERKFTPKAPYDGTEIPKGDYYTRVRWLQPVDSAHLKFQWDDGAKETYVNMYGVIRVSGLAWKRQTSGGFWLDGNDHSRIIAQAVQQLREEDDERSDTELDEWDSGDDEIDADEHE